MPAFLVYMTSVSSALNGIGLTANCWNLQLKEEIELRKQRNIAELNDLDEATRVEIEGFRTGTYLRLEIRDVPYEMVEYFDPCNPILVGGIGLGEENVGYMQVSVCCPAFVFCLFEQLFLSSWHSFTWTDHESVIE